MNYVYLCGQITGATYDEARYGWRAKVTDHLHLFPNIQCLSPMRAKVKCGSDAESLSHMGDADSIMSCPRGITTRDRWDVRRSSLIFANLDMDKISVGSMIEFGWADAWRIPIIAVMPEGNMHEHGIVNELIGFRVQTIEEGMEVAKAILGEGL